MTLIQLKSVQEIIVDSETTKANSERNFNYNLNDKNVKAKLLKGVKRIPYEKVINSSSINLVFNLGAWHSVVLPSILYWNQVKDQKS